MTDTQTQCPNVGKHDPVVNVFCCGSALKPFQGDLKGPRWMLGAVERRGGQEEEEEEERVERGSPTLETGALLW